jgi:pimeloyl-ACP methyl ester carboxylesterase
MAVATIKYDNKNFDIHYDITNSHNQNIILFLHGWGSNKEIMKQAFRTHLLGYKHIYIEMPGFGKTSNNYILTTQDYSNIVKKFLEYLQILPNDIIIAGHSFGGKVATLLQPKLLVLLSSAGIIEPKSKKILLKIRIAKTFNKFGLSKIGAMFRSDDVKHMSANMYETFKNVVDEDFSEIFEAYKKPTLIFWGKNDMATSYESGQKIHSLIQNSKFIAYNLDHYFFLHH